MPNNTSPREQGQPGSPLTPRESKALDELGKWLSKEDPGLARLLGAVEPIRRRWHGVAAALMWLLLAPLSTGLGILLGRAAFARAMSAEAVVLVLGCLGLGAVECLVLLIADGHHSDA